MRQHFLFTFSVIVLLGLAGDLVPVVAQSNSGSRLTVTVRDVDGVIPASNVTVVQRETESTTAGVTDAEGRVTFSGLQAGVYDVTASFSGFVDTYQRDVLVTSGQETAVDLTLSLVQFSSQITVSTANRREQLLLDVAEPTVLIDHGQITDTSARTAKDLLVELSGAGIQVAAGGGQGNLSLNGIPNSGVLVLVDGRRYLGRDANGNFNLEDLPLTGVDRVEVVKGAGSALYGSDALGGVVNFVTRRSTTPGVWTSIDMTGGSYGDFRVNDSAGWRRGRGGVTGSVGHRTYDGFDLSRSNPQTIGQPASKWWNGEARGDVRVSTRLFARLAADYSDRDIWKYFFAGATQLESTVYDSQRNLVRHSISPGFDYQATNRLSLTADYTHGKYIRDETRVFVVGGRIVPQAPWREWNDELKLVARYGIYARGVEHPFQAGYERRQEKLRRATLTVRDPNRDINVFWFQQEVRLTGRLTLTGGARHDDYSDFGSQSSPKGSAVFALAEGHRLHASVGRGFRPPYFGELYLNTPPVFVGNPQLRPEVADTVTTGYAWSSVRTQVAADVYYSRVKNGIVFDLSRQPFTYANLQQYTSRGVNLSTSFNLPAGLAPTASYAYNLREDQLGRNVGGFPTHAVALKLLWNQPRLGLRANVRTQLVGRVPPGTDGSYQPKYQVWYAQVAKTVARRNRHGLSVYAQVANLFDRRDIFRRTAQDLPLTGDFAVWIAPRTVVAGVTIDFDRTK